MTKKQNIIAFIIISILGTLGHFFYEWTNNSYLVGLFFPVNESTWEHLKLLFYPALIYSFVEYFTLKEKTKNYICATVFSVLLGMLSIVVIFYTYKGIIGGNIDFLNIAIYFIALVIMLAAKQKFLENSMPQSNYTVFCITVLMLFALMFALFSYNPPSIGLFENPEMLNT